MPGRENEPMATRTLLFALLDATSESDSGFEVNDRDHALQAATRADRADADDEIVVAALFHDAAKAVDHRRHSGLIADLLALHVRPEVEYALRVHQDFAAAHLDNGRSPRRRLLHRANRHYALAARFVDEWDAPSRDPDYDTAPLEHFEPAVDRVLAQRYPRRIPLRRRVRGSARGRARQAVTRLSEVLGVRRPSGSRHRRPRAR